MGTNVYTVSIYRGWITFYSNDDTVVSRYDTIRHNGLYYITNLNIISPPETSIKQIHTTNVDNPSCYDETLHVHADTKAHYDNTDPIDNPDDNHDTAYDITLDNEYIPGTLHPNALTPIANPIRIHTTSVTTN
jgi:hypothetical protein